MYIWLKIHGITKKKNYKQGSSKMRSNQNTTICLQFDTKPTNEQIAARLYIRYGKPIKYTITGGLVQ